MWPSNEVTGAEAAANARVELGDGERSGVEVDGRVKGCGHVHRLHVVQCEVDAGADEPQFGGAVFRPVVPPMHIPSGIGFG